MAEIGRFCARLAAGGGEKAGIEAPRGRGAEWWMGAVGRGNAGTAPAGRAAGERGPKPAMARAGRAGIIDAGRD